MADGRHFENSFISISQPWIIRFRSNLVLKYKFSFRACRFDTNSNFSNSRWRTDAILKIIFWLYLGAILADQRQIWNRDEGSHADIGRVTKIAIFANSRWRTAAILKIALSPYLSRELSDFDQIWYTNTLIENRFGLYLPIYASFGMEMKNHMQISVAWPKWQFSQIQDSGWPPFWK